MESWETALKQQHFYGGPSVSALIPSALHLVCCLNLNVAFIITFWYLIAGYKVIMALSTLMPTIVSLRRARGIQHMQGILQAHLQLSTIILHIYSPLLVTTFFNLFGSIRISRWGDTNASDVSLAGFATCSRALSWQKNPLVFLLEYVGLFYPQCSTQIHKLLLVLHDTLLIPPNAESIREYSPFPSMLMFAEDHHMIFCRLGLS